MLILNKTIGDADKKLFREDRDNCNEVFLKLKAAIESKGSECKGLKNQPINLIDWIIYWDLDSLPPKGFLNKVLYWLREKKNDGIYRDIDKEEGLNNRLVKKALVLLESPVASKRKITSEEINKFNVIFTWRHDLSGNNIRKFNIPIPVNWEYSNFEDFDKKKLCVYIASNKKSRNPKGDTTNIRYSLIRYLTKKFPDDFDLYGFNWNPTYRFWLYNYIKGSKMAFERFSAYKGIVPSKANVYSKYKYALCLENYIGDEGYISEKIFDAARSGCIPIYKGSQRVRTLFPKNSVIFIEDYPNYDALSDHLKSIDKIEYIHRQSLCLNAVHNHSSFYSDSFVNLLISELF
jgi:hypothetical protein